MAYRLRALDGALSGRCAITSGAPSLVKRLTILGKHWRFVRRRLRRYHGFVKGVGPENPASSTDMTRREIVVDASLRGESELRFILHEFLHAADWHKSEEWVDQVSSDAARFLTRLGYRMTVQQPRSR